MFEQGVLAKLAVFRRQYFQLVDPAQLHWPEGSALKAPEVQSWVYRHLFDSEKMPPGRYRLRVLKMLISKLEDAIDDPEEDEISDNLMMALSSSLSGNTLSEAESAQQKAYVTYAYPRHTIDEADPQDFSVTLHESHSVISSAGTTGLRTWEAALLLGQFLCSDRGNAAVCRKRIFELGAGTGMLSILCAKHLGVSGMVATDSDEAVVDAIKTNIFLNQLDASQVTVSTAALRWGRPLNATTFSEDFGMDVPDVLLGADVTYDKIVIPALVSSMREFFELNPALQILVAATIRNEQTFETFLNTCRRNRFTLEQIDFAPVPEHLQEGPFYPTATPIQIWRITRVHTARDPFAF
ncbi:hypothetical protein BU23DRAFT_648864 [Bimuria novae-zelandiae CBS 107.79]|uniref:Uncharacterized protein n=1 Tax=Bimuria novae-zelandiae CBS 107.79 TaxID=1447943 RepID=A0A6A5V6W1_9PLEO|nr:hypothetical protein BU23DRAFT_648864 [Bimuria novae-zelandiae CBS 107.79]